MKNRVNHLERRKNVLEATVRTVACFGIEGCTSKQIAFECELAENNIYRYFFDLKGVRQAAFDYTEEWLFPILSDRLEKEAAGKDGYEQYVSSLMDTLAEYPSHVRFLSRFYTSTEFTPDLVQKHYERCEQSILRFSPFEKEATVSIPAVSIFFRNIVHFASLINEGLTDNKEELRKRIFLYNR